MTYNGKTRFVELNECPRCGRYAGRRKVRLSIKEEFFVMCEVCKYITKGHTTQHAATNEWNRGVCRGQ